MIIVQRHSKDSLVSYNWGFKFKDGNLILVKYFRAFRPKKKSDNWMISHYFHFRLHEPIPKYAKIIPENKLKIPDDVAADALEFLISKINVCIPSKIKL